MKHPTSRAARRETRSYWIARRLNIINKIWKNSGGWTPKSGRLSKWNLNCGCRICQYNRFCSRKRLQREALKNGLSYSLRAWGIPVAALHERNISEVLDQINS